MRKISTQGYDIVGYSYYARLLSSKDLDRTSSSLDVPGRLRSVLIENYFLFSKIRKKTKIRRTNLVLYFILFFCNS